MKIFVSFAFDLARLQINRTLQIKIEVSLDLRENYDV